MAKKKADHHKPHHQPTMDADAPQLDNLKSLNALLLKETSDRRQEVDSLIQSNGGLKSELNRSLEDNSRLQSEMNALIEKAVMVEIEKQLVSVYVIGQIASFEGDVKRITEEKSEIVKLMNEKESEIEELNSELDRLLVKIDEGKVVLSERDEIRAQLDARIEEVTELRLKVTEAENKMGEILIQVRDLKAKCDGLVEENSVVLKRSEFVMNEKDLIQKKLDESNRLVDDLMKNVKEIHEQKNAVEDEKKTLEVKNNELQILVGELKKVVERLKLEEEALIENFALSSEHQVEMQMKIDVLLEEKNESEERVESLGKEKSLLAKDLEGVREELRQQKVTFEQIVHEKIEAENAKIQLESEIVKISEQLSVFKDTISSLEMESVNQIENIKRLQVEVASYKVLFDKATIERDEAVEDLNKEKTITDDFKQKVIEMEKEVKDLQKELTTESEKYMSEKEELESRCTVLVKKIASLEAELGQTRTEFDDTKGKLGVAEANTKRVLKILKKLVLVCDENNDLDEENAAEEGIKDHVTVVEAIKRDLKDKESKVEEMTRQLEFVKSSADEARKEKSFWTTVSSATTLLAAVVSVAYVARAH